MSTHSNRRGRWTFTRDDIRIGVVFIGIMPLGMATFWAVIILAGGGHLA